MYVGFFSFGSIASISPVDPLVQKRGQSIDITTYHEEVALCVILRRSTPVAGSERKKKTRHLS